MYFSVLFGTHVVDLVDVVVVVSITVAAAEAVLLGSPFVLTTVAVAALGPLFTLFVLVVVAVVVAAPQCTVAWYTTDAFPHIPSNGHLTPVYVFR